MRDRRSLLPRIVASAHALAGDAWSAEDVELYARAWRRVGQAGVVVEPGSPFAEVVRVASR